MADERDDGGPAYPGKIFKHMIAVPENPNDRNSPSMAQPVYDQHSGMSLRDKFAGDALMGLIAQHAHPEASYAAANDKSIDQIAKDAFLIADAMLKARKA